MDNTCSHAWTVRLAGERDTGQDGTPLQRSCWHMYIMQEVGAMIANRNGRWSLRCKVDPHYLNTSVSKRVLILLEGCYLD